MKKKLINDILLKLNSLIYLCFIIALICILGCTDEIKEGCTCETSDNYDPTAENDDESCLGCTEVGADNYNVCASINDGSCIFASLPTVSTEQISEISFRKALVGGNVISDGNANIIDRGIVWDISAEPKINLSTKTSGGTGVGTFLSVMDSLEANTKYYVRAYAINSAGIVYGDEKSFTTLSPPALSDIDGNGYSIVTIGDQIWMAENLRTTTYNDGTSIPLISDPTEWYNFFSLSPGYCWYNNDRVNYGSKYGALYNWYVVNTEKLCPKGWHVPTDTEWKQLEKYLGMSQDEADAEQFRGTNEGGKIKETGTEHWYSPNAEATDEFGFKALPGGYRSFNGNYADIGYTSFWWSATDSISNHAWNRMVYYDAGTMRRNSSYKEYGFCVRCIKNQ